jgi:hypothetical protein
MPARRSPSKPRRSASVARASSKDSPLNAVLQAIEVERDNLSRAESLLGCLTIAMENEGMSHEGPYYPDVAEMALRMLQKSIRALDPINLPDPSPDKVKEEFFAGDASPLALARALHVPLLRRQSSALPPRCSLRLHRRDYSRASAREASSRNSASANISGCVAR